MKYYFLTFFIISSLLLTSCATQKQHNTLRDIDVIKKDSKPTIVYIKPKTNEEIKAAYLEYLKHANSNNKARMTAISRLADIEFDLSDKLLNSNKKNETEKDIWDDKKYYARINKTIELLTTSLRDYPKEKNNDRLLYQLSKAYEQKGDIINSIKQLNQLIIKFPKSPYYIEAQFRIGEAAFTQQDYVTAEDAYTEVISSKKNALYYEKAIFKRGWARFKQNYYIEAVDDLVSAITYHNFQPYNSLDKSEKSQFDEYYRTIGLAFAYAGGVKPLRQYMKSNPGLKFKYQIYLSVSNIYLKQERFSDAVNVLEKFIKHEKKSKHIPYAYLNILNIWDKGGFAEKLNKAVNQFYIAYNPKSPYWKTKQVDKKASQSINLSLKKYIQKMSAYFHKSYQRNKKNVDYKSAKLWYQRYLKNYQPHIRKDNINYLYAELLNSAKQTSEALKYYEKAAYDQKIILNKDAAYATIITTSRLLSTQKLSTKKTRLYLRKHIEYAALYSQLYPNDKRTADIITHATELAFNNRQYSNTIYLAGLIPEPSSEKFIKKTSILSAQSYFKLKKYSEAEERYTELLKYRYSNPTSIKNLKNHLALSIYRQAEVAKRHKDIPTATSHFSRIADITPHTDIAPTGLYDAIALFMSHKLWNKAISAMKKFQKMYPTHKLNHNITKNLSLAYLNSDQNLKAAREFERLAASGSDKNLKKTALLQAAELYEEKGDYPAAIRSYNKYVSNYKKPFSQYMESMYKLFKLNKAVHAPKEASLWRKRIINADSRTYKKNKTARTKFIASTAIISLAREKDRKYRGIQLIHPLKKNLRRKKKEMQRAVQLYGKASVYKISEVSTEATYAIASIYNDFSKALLKAELPRNLNKDEREQYMILLEDQAFPFEEKAIEFYEINMEHTKNNIYNNWIRKSFDNLKILFPVRYNRELKIDRYINVLH